MASGIGYGQSHDSESLSHYGQNIPICADLWGWRQRRLTTFFLFPFKRGRVGSTASKSRRPWGGRSRRSLIAGKHWLGPRGKGPPTPQGARERERPLRPRAVTNPNLSRFTNCFISVKLFYCFSSVFFFVSFFFKFWTPQSWDHPFLCYTLIIQGKIIIRTKWT
jgi:hypothetical protein